jgi:polyisoprenoid-binding protein YceI
MGEQTAVTVIDGIEAPPAGEWQLDAAHTGVSFVARHMMVTKVRGHFSDLAGTIHVAERPEDSWVEVAIKTASIDTGNEMRDNHLKSADFLDVEKWPELTFKSSKIELTGGNRLRVHGNLTIRTVTRPVLLEGEYEGSIADLRGGTRIAFSARTEIDREDFGITWNVVLESGGVLVSRKVQIELEVAAVRRAAEQAA